MSGLAGHLCHLRRTVICNTTECSHWLVDFEFGAHGYARIFIHNRWVCGVRDFIKEFVNGCSVYRWLVLKRFSWAPQKMAWYLQITFFATPSWIWLLVAIRGIVALLSLLACCIELEWVYLLHLSSVNIIQCLRKDFRYVESSYRSPWMSPVVPVANPEMHLHLGLQWVVLPFLKSQITCVSMMVCGDTFTPSLAAESSLKLTSPHEGRLLVLLVKISKITGNASSSYGKSNLPFKPISTCTAS